MVIEDIQNICKTLPAVTEDIKWEHDLCFNVGHKMFLVVDIDNTPMSASFKVTDDEFEELTTKEGFKPAPYLARHKWVHVDDIKRLSKSEWEKYINQSYQLIKSKLSKKKLKELGIVY
jgi:predicted DNA-binding protein (MmcQ/YjbR family)